GRELLVRHRLLPAVTDAGRREDLDDVGAVLLQLPHDAAELVGRPAVLVDLADRREDARAGKHAPRDRLAQLDVVRLARALNRREPGHQRYISVFSAVKDLLRRRRAARLIAPVGT